MKRDKLNDLIRWKNSNTRKPLVIRGARQVGKTWLLKEFGQTHYRKLVYINFENTPNLKQLFSKDLDVKRILSILEIHSGFTITPNDTLIVFDEIQEAPSGLTALKYFCEDAPLLHIIAAGSLLGLSMPNKTSFPVGKVDFTDMYPMSFLEFITALGEDKLSDAIKNRSWEIIDIFHEKLIDYLRTYYYIGGMPEVVQNFINNQKWDEVRLIQHRILNSYEADFSKHAPLEIIPRIRMVWQSIPLQLAKKNKKFIYGAIREGARAKDFELAIQWLVDAGVLLKVHRITKPELPLMAFQDLSAFKLYLLDVGLLSAMVNLDKKAIIQGDKLFLQFKGALTEQYVIEQLQNTKNLHIGYWTNSRNTAEVDFIVQTKTEIIPIEVKAETNLKAKSFKLFCEKYKPKTAIRTSLQKYKHQSWITNIPLYAINNTEL
ncbi:MAG: ATP-binding protein [Bacteroidales bacterium]|nr:ATP-binding protein [Bacteroidales bacterium]MDD4217924.1 ATP-binding protein [Bacteroidales bacterium]MDY0143148.1 ATP-binding protein [Bacteroidales bacterium]